MPTDSPLVSIAPARGGVRSELIPGADACEAKTLTVKQSTEILHGFIGAEQLHCIRLGARGEEKDYFISLMSDLARRVADMPKTYGQDGKGKETIAYLHYFTAGCDWYITEKDCEVSADSAGEKSASPGQHQAFGLADLGQGYPEMGYISIVEILENRGELDLHWEPKTLAEIGKKSGEEIPPQAAEEIPENVIIFPGRQRAVSALERLQAL
jgi:hypothetical protein